MLQAAKLKETNNPYTDSITYSTDDNKQRNAIYLELDVVSNLLAFDFILMYNKKKIKKKKKKINPCAVNVLCHNSIMKGNGESN